MAGDNVSLVAAGVGFYGLLAIFPAITAIISIWGLFLDPETVTRQIREMSDMLPPQARSLISVQATMIAAGTGPGISLAAMAGIMLALFSSMKGVRSLIGGLNIIYGKTETRGFIRLQFLTATLTLALLMIMIGTLGLLVVYPLLINLLDFGPIIQALTKLARWPILALIATLGMTILYRFGPDRHRPGWRRTAWGAMAGTGLWIITSIGFSVYLRYFNSYNATYGALGAAIVLLMWFWVSSFAILLGAGIEAELNRRFGPERHGDTGTPATQDTSI